MSAAVQRALKGHTSELQKAADSGSKGAQVSISDDDTFTSTAAIRLIHDLSGTALCLCSFRR